MDRSGEGSTPGAGLSELKDIYRKTLDALSDAIHVVDRDLVVTMCNETLCAWNRELGLDDQPTGKPLFEVYPFLTEGVSDEYARVFRSGERLFTEERTEVAGSFFVTRTRKLPIVRDGIVTEVITAIDDITEKCRAEDALRQSEEKYRTLLDLTPDPVVIVQDGVHKLVNQAFVDTFGYSREEVASGLHFLRLVPEESLDMVRRRYEERLAGKPIPRTTETDLVVRSGRRISCEATAALIPYEGRPADLVVIRDVTDRRRAERALRESEEKFRTLAEESPNMIFINDMGRLVYVNRKCVEVLGYSREEFCSGDFNYLKLIAPEYHREQLANFEKHVRGEQVPTMEYAIVTRGGERLAAIISTALIDYEGTRAILGIVTDITERKRFEEQLLAYQQELQALAAKLSSAEDEERRRLAGDLHDHVGQTLAAAKMKLGALRRLADCDECTELAGELGDLLDRTIADTRSLTFQLSPPLLHEMGLGDAAEWLVEQVRDEYGLDVELEVDLPPAEPGGTVRGLLFRGLRELLLNVVKHAQADSARVGIAARGGSLEVSVRDDGKGFARDAQSAGPGSTGGFGLFSLRERLAQLGGRLEIGTAPGGGGVVRMIVPLKVNTGTDAGTDG